MAIEPIKKEKSKLQGTKKVNKKQPQTRVDPHCTSYQVVIDIAKFKTIKQLKSFFASYIKINQAKLDWTGLSDHQVAEIKKICAVLSIDKPNNQQEIISHYEAYETNINHALKNMDHESLAYLGVLVLDKKMQLKTAYFLETLHKLFNTALKLALSFTAFAEMFLRISFIPAFAATPVGQMATSIAIAGLTLYVVGKILFGTYKAYKISEAELKEIAFDAEKRVDVALDDKIERIVSGLDVLQTAFNQSMAALLKFRKVMPH